MSKYIMGIDPGSNGAFVILDSNGEVIELEKMPETIKDIFEFVKKWKGKDIVCYLEKVQGLPGMGGSPMFNFGKNYGSIETSLLGNEIKFITVTPQKWQKHYQLGTTKKEMGKDWKNHLKAKAQQLFPRIKVTLWSADCLLIGEYGRAIN